MLRHLIVTLLCTAVALAASSDFGAPLFIPGDGIADRNLTTDYARDALGRLFAQLEIGPASGRMPPLVLVEKFHGACAGSDGTIYVGKSYLEQVLTGKGPYQKIDPTAKGINDAVYRILHDARKLDYLASMLGHELGHYRANDPEFADHPRDPLYQALQARRDYIKSGIDDAQRQALVDTFEAGIAGKDTPPGPGRAGGRAALKHHTFEYMADQHAILANFVRTGDLHSALRGRIREYDRPYTMSHPSAKAQTLQAIMYVRNHPEVFAGALEKPLVIPVPGGPVTLERDGDTIRARGLDEQLAKLRPEERTLIDKIEQGYLRQRANQLGPDGARNLDEISTPERQALSPRENPGNRGNGPVLAERGQGAPSPGRPASLLGVVAEPVPPTAARAATGFGANALTGVGIGLGTNAIDQLVKTGHVDWDATAGLLKDPNFWRTTAGNLAGGAIGALVPGGRLLKLAGSIAGATVGGSLASSEKTDWKRVAAGTAGSIAGAALLGWFPGGAIVGGIAGGMLADWTYDTLTAPPAPALRGASFLP